MLGYILRLIATVISWWIRGRPTKNVLKKGVVVTTTHMCLPFDLDSNIHMNNSRYSYHADFARVAWYLEAGLSKVSCSKYEDSENRLLLSFFFIYVFVHLYSFHG